MNQRPHDEEPPTPTGADAASIPKAPTGIVGFDEVLMGGLPRGRTTLIGGGPGSGKTVFALESLYRAAADGEPGVFVTFEESADAIRRNALAMGWDLAPLERDDKLRILAVEPPVGAVRAGDFDIGATLGILGGLARAIGARRVVVDAVDLLLRLFEKPDARDQQLAVLHAWLVDQGLTAILTMKLPSGTAAGREGMEYMVDCAVRLDHRVVGQVATRRLRVLKYRGSGFMSNEYPYVIAPGGVVLMPVSTAALAQQPLGPRFSTGVDGLDRALGGGLRAGSCVLVAGASGTGKSTLAASLAHAACTRGERVLYINLEESVEGFVSGMQSPGIDLAPCIDDGSIRIVTGLPESLGVEEHLCRIFGIIDDFKPGHLVFDAISACRRMGSDHAAFDFLVRLLTHCKARGVTCVLANQIDPGQGLHAISGVGISSLVDSLILLEQDWSDDVHRRTLLVVKSRGTRHTHTRIGFRITDEGVKLNGDAGRGGEP